MIGVWTCNEKAPEGYRFECFIDELAEDVPCMETDVDVLNEIQDPPSPDTPPNTSIDNVMYVSADSSGVRVEGFHSARDKS